MELTHTAPRRHLEYPEATMFEMVARAARALWAYGVRPGDAVTICLPNIPQALDCFYAVDRGGDHFEGAHGHDRVS